MGWLTPHSRLREKATRTGLGAGKADTAARKGWGEEGGGGGGKRGRRGHREKRLKDRNTCKKESQDRRIEKGDRDLHRYKVCSYI